MKCAYLTNLSAQTEMIHYVTHRISPKSGNDFRLDYVYLPIQIWRVKFYFTFGRVPVFRRPIFNDVGYVNIASIQFNGFKCERHRFKLNVIFIKFLFHPKLWFFCPGLIRWLPKYPDCPKSSCTKLRLYPKELSFHVRLNLRDKSVDEVLILKSYHGGCRSADNSSLSSLFRLGMSRTQWLWR